MLFLIPFIIIITVFIFFFEIAGVLYKMLIFLNWNATFKEDLS